MARRIKPEQIAIQNANAPTVVLAGRANVGKSTLFNRIAGRRAIVSPIAGTTRDLNIARASHGDRDFTLIDSGGLESYSQELASQRAMEKALRAIGMADLVVLVMDGREGVTGGDREALELIRETGRPVIVAANKVDTRATEAVAADAYALGIE
ncbi:MAG TPA: GTPase, partial [Candidatus Binataceae bacterium]|nr:GTPase [Candidatus Binataceae bacterium]